MAAKLKILAAMNIARDEAWRDIMFSYRMQINQLRDETNTYLNQQLIQKHDISIKDL
ncbi:hypothetical protein GCM10023211_04940 [Orbus sasakiae]|uniref:Uncharacterized protein n=1 Tax=Orbus sasakiae TaxID=1078475 RepID=A0ABP9N004_9GAMM